MTAIGVLFGLPVDIRHIKFSSAYLEFSLAGLDFALSVAMKARKVTFAHGPTLLKSLGRRFRLHPEEFFLPPRMDVVEAEPPTEGPVH